MQNTKFFLVVVLVIVAVLADGVKCDGENEDGLWSRLKKMVREFVDSMKSIWNDMKSEIKSRTSDVTSWTKELFDSFKVKMNEWVDQVGGASDKEKEDMRNYIERLEMPEDAEEK